MTTFFTSTNEAPQTVAHTVGPFNPTPADESTLDIQYLEGVAPNAVNWYWSEPNWLFEASCRARPLFG